MEKNNCDNLYKEYSKILYRYEILSKEKCITNSCKRNKEEIYGNLEISLNKLYNCICNQHNNKS